MTGDSEEIRIDKAEYTLTLSADDVRYIGNAMEVYHRALYELYLKPQLEEMCKKMTGMSLKEARKQAYKTEAT